MYTHHHFSIQVLIQLKFKHVVAMVADSIFLLSKQASSQFHHYSLLEIHFQLRSFKILFCNDLTLFRALLCLKAMMVKYLVFEVVVVFVLVGCSHLEIRIIYQTNVSLIYVLVGLFVQLLLQVEFQAIHC